MNAEPLIHLFEILGTERNYLCFPTFMRDLSSDSCISLFPKAQL